METNTKAELSKFLEDNAIYVDIRKLGVFPYFPGEKESRAVYEVAITNGKNGKSFSYRFGQSIIGSFFTVLYGNKIQSFEKMEDAITYANSRGIRLSAISKPSKPEVIEVLYCEYEPCESFDDFCANFGYDTDSRKALDTYLAIDKQNAWIVATIGHRLANKLREIAYEC